MRIAVLGNSDTSGLFLALREKPWPSLLREQVGESLGEPLVVDSWRWVPARPDAVERALALVEDAQPDIAILPLASFWCAFGTVRARVDRRLGKRAGRLYGRAERAFTRRIERRRPPSATTSGFGRRFGRRFIGTETYMSLDQFIAVFSNLIRALSQQEELQVLVLGDHHFNIRIRDKIAAIEPAIARSKAAIQPLVAERELQWGDLEEAISAGGRREEMISWDGVHMTAEAHERVATALARTLTAMATRL